MRVGSVPGGCIISGKRRKGTVSFLGRVGRVPYPFSEGSEVYRILSRKGRKGTGRGYPFSGGSEGYRESTYPFSEGSEGYREGVSFLGGSKGYRILSRNGPKGTGRVYPFSEGYLEDTVSFIGRVGRVSVCVAAAA